MKQRKFKDTINANGYDITIISDGREADYLSLTDIARYKSSEPSDVIKNWMRNRDTIDFLGLWEMLNNPDFRVDAFNDLQAEAGRNSFTLSPQKWVSLTNAKGIYGKSGIGGGTFAQKDIAFEFASWVSAEFKLYIIKDYQRLKADENSRISLEWNLSRTLSKINYKIHTDAIKETLVPRLVSKQQQSMTYASEADVINMALFGKTAREWRAENPEACGNIRDNANLVQLIVISNLESLNAEYIRDGLSQGERLVRLNQTAIRQMQSLAGREDLLRLQEKNSE